MGGLRLAPIWQLQGCIQWLTTSRFHGPDTKLEDLTHPEDIEHFKMHERLEEEQEREEKMLLQPIVEENIPEKFRRQQ